MPDITLTFEDGKQHVYQNAPDTLKPEDVYARASKDFPNVKVKGISRGVAPAPKKEAEGMALPDGGFMFFDPKQQEQFQKGQTEGIKGVASGLAQLATGAAELVDPTGYAAKAGKYLKTVGDPTMQEVGKMTGAFIPLPIGKGEAVAAGLSLGKRLWEGAKGGAKVGGIYGAAAPTYEEELVPKYKKKILQALEGGALGSVIGGPLAAAFGRRPPAISVESVMEEAKTTGQSMFDAARKMANEKFGEGTKRAEQEFVSILQEAERRYGDLQGAQLKREIATRKVAAARERQPVAEDVNLSQSRSEAGLPSPTTSNEIAKNVDPNSQLRILGQQAYDAAEKVQEEVGGGAFKAFANEAAQLQQTNPVGTSEAGQEFRRFLIQQMKGGAGELKTAGQAQKNLAEEVFYELFNKKRPTDFNLWEAKLRELRERTKGKVAEGFTPIQIKRINDIADKLEGTLNTWAGRDVASKIYAVSSKDKNKFVSDLGEALTKQEQVPFEAAEGMFKTPQSALEKTIFKSSDSVRYAKELMGEQPINKIGEQYAVNQLRYKDSSAVKKWLDDSSNEFVNGIPGLRDKLTKYQAALAEREGRSKAMEALQKQFRGGIERSRATLQDEVNKVTDFLKQAAADRGTSLTKAESELEETLDTINKFNETIRKLPAEKILERWPEARVKMEQTGLFNPQELDALGDQLSKAAQIAEQKAREAAATSALMNAVGTLAKKAGVPVTILGGLGAGGAAVYRAVKD